MDIKCFVYCLLQQAISVSGQSNVYRKLKIMIIKKEQVKIVF